MGPLDFSEITTKSTLHLLPSSLPASSAAGAEQRCPPPRWAAGQLLLPHRHTRHLRDPLAPLPSRWTPPPLATPSRPSSAAATSPSRWRARYRAPEPYLLCASALQEPPRPVPLTLSPFHQPQTPEHLRRSPERRRASSSPSTHSSKAAPPAPT